LGRKSAEGGRSFANRAEAVRDFQTKHAAKYPSTFEREPGTRPPYIPQTVWVDRRSYPVYYDWRYGGYGYWDGPVWRAYEVVRDAVMLNALMDRHQYVVPAGYGPMAPGVVVHQSSGWGFVVGVFCVLIIAMGVVIVLRILF
jgi:hypothetical protein